MPRNRSHNVRRASHSAGLLLGLAKAPAVQVETQIKRLQLHHQLVSGPNLFSVDRRLSLPVTCNAKGKHESQVGASAESKPDVAISDASEESPKQPLRLILLRHAKSSWDDPSLKDHERPLNNRGRKAAPNVAAQLRSRGWLPELILSSDSVRTQETLQGMRGEWGELADVPTEFLHSFYEVAATEDGLTDTPRLLKEAVIEKAEAARSAMLVGHNMGWEQAASQFAGKFVPMKTAYAVLLESPCSSWKEAFQERWHLVAVVKPESSKAS
ncbi:hypothetical protein KFL_000250110 [Klebsormidium nitens]|uniref:Phosphoglycerate mutase family protein n=1 Tax=Klebsormidium nitens TaxID=105231 RepID=A0A1Y1HKL0_KLENI|nr:hypothetical protein KFL_000250110 [Klebsormidium nitens]|eukprot:GAQ79134.1 hypothetical protein KFL_000250110 [Klebsormidium nitens]